MSFFSWFFFFFQTGSIFCGTLEEAQWRKIDTYLARAQLEPNHVVLDIMIGCVGWSVVSLRAAIKYGCHVIGIVPTLEQKIWTEQHIQEMEMEHLVTIQVVKDYRIFCNQMENHGKFDRIICCDMNMATTTTIMDSSSPMKRGILFGRRYRSHSVGDFFWAMEQVLNPYNGKVVMGTITTPEEYYKTHGRTNNNFIQSMISRQCLYPSLHTLIDGAYYNSHLTLEHVDNLGLHHAETLTHWRNRFNQNFDQIRTLGNCLDDCFLRGWNFYLTYCQAEFLLQRQQFQLLVFARCNIQTWSTISSCQNNNKGTID